MRSLFSGRVKAIASILAALLIGCDAANDALKAPSFVTVEFLLQESTHPKLDFTTGFIRINNFEFTGLRDNADDVHFIKAFPTGFGSTLAITSAGVPMQEYDIPQGVYDKIDVTLHLYAADDSHTTAMAGLQVDGNFTRADGTLVPLRAEIAADANVNIAAVSDTGSPQITLLQSRPATLQIAFYAPDWFESMSMSTLESATLTEIDGMMVLLISKTVNPDLYAIILNNLDEGVRGVFMSN